MQTKIGTVLVMRKTWNSESCQFVYEPCEIEFPLETKSGEEMVAELFEPVVDAVSIAIFCIGVIAILLAFLS